MDIPPGILIVGAGDDGWWSRAAASWLVLAVVPISADFGIIGCHKNKHLQNNSQISDTMIQQSKLFGVGPNSRKYSGELGINLHTEVTL